MSNEDFSEDPLERLRKSREEIGERLNRKDYLLTVYQKGDSALSAGDPERERLIPDVSIRCVHYLRFQRSLTG